MFSSVYALEQIIVNIFEHYFCAMHFLKHFIVFITPAPICTHCPPGKCPRSRPAGGGQRLTSKSSGRKTGPRSGEPEKSPEAWSTLFASTVKPAGSRRLRWAPEPSRSLPGSAERPCGGRPEKATLPPSWKLLRLALQPNCLMHFAATTHPRPLLTPIN